MPTYIPTGKSIDQQVILCSREKNAENQRFYCKLISAETKFNVNNQLQWPLTEYQLSLQKAYRTNRDIHEKQTVALFDAGRFEVLYSNSMGFLVIHFSHKYRVLHDSDQQFSE